MNIFTTTRSGRKSKIYIYGIDTVHRPNTRETLGVSKNLQVLQKKKPVGYLILLTTDMYNMYMLL